MAYRPPAPFVAPTTGTIDQRLARFADAINRKADQTLMPVYSAVRLIAPDGSVWALTISDAGALEIAVVPR
jgi:hypothetical protein